MLLYAPAILRSNAFQFAYTAYLFFSIVLKTNNYFPKEH